LIYSTPPLGSTGADSIRYPPTGAGVEVNLFPSFSSFLRLFFVMGVYEIIRFLRYLAKLVKVDIVFQVFVLLDILLIEFRFTLKELFNF
jgi:hypothetical protein